MHDRITPVVLTYNEESNIARTLSRLRWAQEIVIVDSGSVDNTQAIVAEYKNTRLIERPFDSHAEQWNFALKETGIATDWVLALDADYLISEQFIDELESVDFDGDVVGYRAAFRYCLFGKKLRGSLYPPVVVLFKRSLAHYEQDGHTQRVTLGGRVANLSSMIDHDDRKPLSHWLQSQNRYMALEAKHIQNSDWNQLDWNDKIRKLILPAPVFVFFYCLVIRKGLLDGRAGLYYAMQRAVAEAILSLRLLESMSGTDAE